MSDLQSQDYIRRSATTLTPPSTRNHEQEVAKLIDVTRCIGCKACQSACMEWNNLRPEVGYFEGSYENPMDLSPEVWTLMRFDEWENEKGNLEWLIRKDGCMHCEDPGCLKACPAPGAGQAFRQPGSSQCMQPSLRISHSRLPCSLSHSVKRISVHTLGARSIGLS